MNSDTGEAIGRLLSATQNLHVRVGGARSAASTLIASVRRELDRLQQELESHEVTPDLRMELERLRRERDYLREELAAARSGIAQKHGEIAVLKKELQKAWEECDGQHRRITQLETELRAVREPLTHPLPVEPEMPEIEEVQSPAAVVNEQPVQELEARVFGFGSPHMESSHVESSHAESLHADSPYTDSSQIDPQQMQLGEILVHSKTVTKAQLAEALREQAADTRRKLGAILIAKGYVDEQGIAEVLAKQLGLPFEHLSANAIEANAVAALPARLARLHKCVPLRIQNEHLCIAMSNPLDIIAIDEVEWATKRHISVVVATNTDVERAIEYCYNSQHD